MNNYKAKMVKSLVAMMAIVMLLAMVSCGKKSSDANSTGTNSAEAKATDGKTYTIIMPWSVGGGPDTFARKVASFGEKYLGASVIVQNVTGGAGTIAMQDFLSREADGQTVVVANGPLFSLTPSVIDVNYKLDDIAPLYGMRQVEFVVLSKNPELKTIDDLKNYGKDHVIKFATTGGPGNDSYTMINVLMKKLGLNAEAVPYDGGQEAINALAGGHVDLAIGSPPVYRQYVIDGELNCIGTFIPEGIEVDGIGKIPSFKSAGIDAEFLGMDYFAMHANAPQEQQEKFKQFLKDVYADEEFKKFMQEMGMEPWQAEKDEIISQIQKQTEDMKGYIDLLK